LVEDFGSLNQPVKGNPIMNIMTGVFGLFTLACAYSAQYWAWKCRNELREIKEELKKKN